MGASTKPLAPPAGFGAILRRLRLDRGWSQLQLALSSGVSQRHISFLESGRSQPSREMVRRLSETLELPLRHQNTLSNAAGFTPAHAETDWSDQALAPWRLAIEALVEAHDPHPAYLVDRFWNVLLENTAAGRLRRALGVARAPERPDGDRPNLIRQVLDPQGLKPFIEAWGGVAAFLVRRLERECLAGDRDLQAFAREVREAAGGAVDNWSEAAPPADSPVLPLTLLAENRRLSFFTAITRVGAPLDVTLQEVRIETMLAADAATSDFMRALAESRSAAE